MSIPEPARPQALAVFPSCPWLCRRVAAALPAAEGARCERLAAAIRADRAEQLYADELHAVLHYVAALDVYTATDPAALAHMAVILRYGRVRDELYEIAAGREDRLYPDTTPYADLALYGLLVQATTGPDLGHAATLAALTLYTRAADATTATVLLDKAIAANPADHVALTLHTAVTQGLPPASVATTFQRSHTLH